MGDENGSLPFEKEATFVFLITNPYLGYKGSTYQKNNYA